MKLLRCDWLGRNRLIITWAVRHLAITTSGNGRCNAFRAVCMASKVSRYLSILCLRSNITDCAINVQQVVTVARVHISAAPWQIPPRILNAEKSVKWAYPTMTPQKCPLSWGDPGLRLTHCSFGPNESTSQTASQSVHPL